ncbi:transposable element Tcb2 transposase [Trichonephila clavipes]|nr:transposable element Tcb2 transposase [Trichonephila clavipes]
MPTSAIKDLSKKWADVRAMVLECHPNQADVTWGVARQVGRSDLTVRRCWDHCTFTRRPGLGRPRQISRREDCHIKRHAHAEPTASLVAVQTLAAPSLRAHVPSRTISRSLPEGHLVSWRPLSVLPTTLPHHRQRLRLELCRARRDWNATQWNQVKSSSDKSRFNLSGDNNHVRV